MARAVSKRRMARSDLLWWAGAFVGMQLVLAVLLDSWLGICRDPEYAYRRWLLRDWMRREPDRPVVVVLGTSRTMFGLRPDVLESRRPGRPDDPLVFNFGMAGYGPVHQCVELKRLLRDGVRPEAFVIEIVPFTLANHPEKSDTIPVTIQTWSDLAELQRFRGEGASIYQDWLLARTMPVFSYRFQLLGRFLPSWVPESRRSQLVLWRGIDQRGWLPSFRNRSIEEGIAETESRVKGLLRNLPIHPGQRQALHEMLDTLRREKIPFVVTLMPEGPTFRSWYGKEAEANLQALLADIESRHGVKVIDGRGWCPDELLYLDGHHLDQDGATVYTERFNEEVLPALGTLRKGGQPEIARSAN